MSLKIRMEPILGINFGFQTGLEISRRKERREGDR